MTNVPAISSALPDMGASMLRVGGALVLVIAIFLGGVWLFKNWQRLTLRQGAAPKLNVLEVRSLGQRQAIYVVGYEQQRLLLASSTAGITLLSHLPSADERAGGGRDQNEFCRSLSTGLGPQVMSALSPKRAWMRRGFLALLFLLAGEASLHAQTNSASNLSLNIGLNGLNQPVDVDGAIKVLAIMTLLTLAPSIILLMTCFTRIVIVLSFVRSALSLQGAPSNQIIIGLSLFLTFFIMAPVWEKIDHEALEPYRAKQITSQEALERAAGPIRDFHAQADAAQGRGIVRRPGQDRGRRRRTSCR